METARKIRLYTSLTILVISLVLAGTTGAATVNTPMTEDLDANSFDIYGVSNLDVDVNATVLGVLTGTEKITSVGPELLADPGFDDANEWTGTAWVINGVAQCVIGSATTLTEVNPFTVKANTTYLVDIHVTVVAADLTISLGGVTTETFRNGEHIFLIETTDTNSLSINKASGSTPNILTWISVKEVGPAELGDTHVYLDLSVDEDIDANNVTITDALNVGGNADITGTVSTTSDDTWDLNDYTADPNASSSGYVTVTINGTEYRLLAAPAP